MLVEVSPPTEAPPNPVPNAEPANVGTFRLSRKRPFGSVKFLTNGGLFPPICKAKTRGEHVIVVVPEGPVRAHLSSCGLANGRAWVLPQRCRIQKPVAR